MSESTGRFQKLRLREHQVFLLLTIVISILAGLSAVLFTLAIEQTSRRLFGLAPSGLRLFAVPPLMSLVTGVLLARFFPDVRGSGVPQTEAAYHLKDGVIPGRVPFGKFITGVMCIGSGHSMGREGPSVQIGAGLASAIGQRLGLSPRRIRDLVPVGAAAALAAAFNTPVAAVIFALEEIIGDLNAPLLGSTVVAAVSSVVVERSLLGNEPLFRVPAYHLVHPAELIAYALLGVVGGAVSLLFGKGLLGLRGLFLRLPRSTKVLQPAVGGLVIGAMLVFSPAIMGVGYEYMDQALNGGLLLKTMAVLCLLKMTATVVSYSSGNAGGIFAPSLYIGAMVGGVVGVLAHGVSPFPIADPGAYALVGMGTLFAGIVRAPMTSVFMIFEITQDYQILVPLMVANMLSFAISRRFQPTPLYHALLEQDGVRLPGMVAPEAVGPTAGDIMQTDAVMIPPDVSIERAFYLTAGRASAYLIGTREGIEGTVTQRQLTHSYRRARQGDLPVIAIANRHWPHAHADHSLDDTLERFARSDGILPVVSRADGRSVQGVITRERLLDSGIGLADAGCATAPASEPQSPGSISTQPGVTAG